MSAVRFARLAGLALLAATEAPAHARAQAPSAPDPVDRYVRAELARERIPGLSVLVLRGGRVVLARGYGYANVEHHVPATDSTVYQSGSLGKQFTAAAILMLAREGRLALDAPVRRYLPEGPARWDGVTIRHLLTHTSGIPDYADSTLDTRRDYTEDELVRLAASLPPAFAPGEHWSYSNTGYVLLGVVIHRVTGAFYGDFLRDRIFRPLGMRSARVISEADIVPNRAAGYRLSDGRLENQEWVSPSLNTTADGSLYLSIRDWARWALALDRGGIPDREDLRASWTPVRLRDGGTYPYGFGWSLDEQRGHPRIGHTGAWQGFRTSIQRYPEYGLTVVVLANLEQALPEAISFGVAGIVEPALRPPHLLRAPLPGAGPPAPLPQALAAVAAGADSSQATPGWRAFPTLAEREELGRRLARVGSWTPLGCDDVSRRQVWRFGARVTRICYVRGEPGDAGAVGQPGLIASALYADRRLAAVEWYDF